MTVTTRDATPTPAGTSFVLQGGLRTWMHVPSRPAPASLALVRRQVGAVLAAQRTRTGGPATSTDDPAALAASVDACLAAAAGARQESVLLATGLPAREAVLAAVAVAEPLEDDPEYLLGIAGAREDDVMGRPVVEGLPADLQDGVSVLRYDEIPGGTLMASLVLARRAWQHDVVVTLRTTELQVVPFCRPSLLELLAAVQPATDDGRHGGRTA